MADKEPGHRRSRRATRVWRLLLLHPVRLIRALLAEHARPRTLGAAGAFGALIGTLPLLGLHTVLVYMGARRFMLNRIVALGANQLGMPPVVPALCIEIGYYLRHGTWLTEVSLRTLGLEAPQRFWEWMLGSLVVGPVLALVVGGTIWVLAELVQRRPPVEGAALCASGGCRGGERGEATPAGQPRAAGTASPAPAPIGGRHVEHSGRTMLASSERDRRPETGAAPPRCCSHPVRQDTPGSRARP